MSHLPKIFFTVLLLLIVAVTTFGGDSKADISNYLYVEDPTSNNNDTKNQATANDKISDLFNGLETTGSTYNSGGASKAALALASVSCRAALERAMKTNLANDLSLSLTPKVQIPSVIRDYITGKFGGIGQNSVSQLCAALQGESVSPINTDALSGKGIRNDLIPQLLNYGQYLSQSTGLPFLSRLEIETGISERSFVSSVTSVQPLWQDANDLHHIFAQLSWYKAPDSEDDGEFKTQKNTYNMGLAYRYLTPNKTMLYGTNIFFDYAPENDHTRLSIGFDARTSQLAFSANRYLPISSWRSLDSYSEERVAAGWDAELRGQVPSLPSWTGLVKGYEWDGADDDGKLFGTQLAVEYSPITALALRMGIRDESDSTASLEAALRFNWRFDQPADLQLKQKTSLAPVSDYVYEKVQRENIIRVKQRRKASSKLTVIETSGANTSIEETGTTSLHVGQTLLMPVTVTTANTAGAVSRLRFADGSTLTSAQNTQVLIEPTLITLITGSIQYTSNGTIETVVTPGGTINLHGTDIDVVSDGTDSSVRVRDGSVTFVGTTSGSATLLPAAMAKSISGIVGSVASGTATYTSHTDTISSLIDRIASALTGSKVTPYPYEAPRIVSSNLNTGQQIVLGLKYNDNVTISGGTPRLTFTINSNTRVANLSGGSGTNDLLFSYTVQAADVSATSILITGLDENGASIMGNGKEAVTTIADKALPVGSNSDTTAPTGYAVAFNTDPITNSNKSSVSIGITGAEVGTTYNYTISSSGGGTNVTGNGLISTATQNITGINTTSLADGTLTVSLTLTDLSSNVGSAVTDTATKDVTAPTGYTAAFVTTQVTDANKNAIAFDILSAEVGSTYAYTISSSGGGTNVTGTGTISTATTHFTNIDLTGLTDGTLTVSVTLTDTLGNAGTAATATIAKDASAPSGYTAVFTTNPITSGNKAAAAFNIVGAEVGATYSYSISSTGGGTPVTGSGTVTQAPQPVTGIDLTGLTDGTYTVSVTLTDTVGNVGSVVTGTTGADTTAPTGYAVVFTTAPVNNANKTAAAFRLTAGEVGSTYNYSISSSGGGTPATGTGSVTTSTMNFTNLNLSGLADGTVTLSLTLTDTAGNVGTAQTNTVTKDIVAPTGYAAVFTTDPIGSSNYTSASFQFSGAEVGATYNYTISSSGGGTNVTGSGTISTATDTISSINTSTLNDGTLTLSVRLVDTVSNAGSYVTDTVIKDIGAPTGYSVNFTTDPVNSSNYTAASFQFAGAEIGSTYSYTISSSGGGTNVTGSGTIATATDTIAALNTTGLNDGTLTVSVTLTDTTGNTGTAATDTVTKDIVAPTITSITFTNGTYGP